MRPLICREIPNREGTALATDIWLPDGPGPWPVVLTRTPYHRAGASARGAYYTDRGYAFVIQDTRGKYDSKGRFRALDHEAADGQDTLDWIANRKWCNGRIGMIGRSYLGIVQIPAAAGGHEALRCILPGVAPNRFFVDWIRYDGCFALANMIRWSLTHDVCPTMPYTGHFSWQEVWQLGARSTLAAVEEKTGLVSQQLRKWVEHDHYDDYWASIDQSALYAQVACPGLHQAGFFDHISRGQFDSFRTIREKGASQQARRNQRLLVGPWGHGRCDQHTYGQWEFGAKASIDLMAYQQRFLDLWLKDLDDGISEEPPVTYFQMGENRWEHTTDWPPPRAELQDWRLASEGLAAGGGRPGSLTRETAAGADADAYVYNPAAPVPTLGGQIYWGLADATGLGPVDQGEILGRTDVLCYRSHPLPAPLVVAGSVELELWVTSDADDTDFIAKFCVVDPFGSVLVLSVGSIRCRYRESWSRPQALVRGEPARLCIHLNNLAYTFPKRARIALVVTSSCSPRILPHPNTMAPTWRETNPRKARQEILHTPAYPSRLILPVIPAS